MSQERPFRVINVTFAEETLRELFGSSRKERWIQRRRCPQQNRERVALHLMPPQENPAEIVFQKACQNASRILTSPSGSSGAVLYVSREILLSLPSAKTVNTVQLSLKSRGRQFCQPRHLGPTAASRDQRPWIEYPHLTLLCLLYDTILRPTRIEKPSCPSRQGAGGSRRKCVEPGNMTMRPEFEVG